jgi:GNAT superfamily N-acetyltransferase
MEIRDALPEDAESVCQVLRRSISELCIADHENRPELLERWLSNKTPEIIASWIAQPGNSMLVVANGSAIIGVGLVTDKGEINLNYVAPEARFQGVSRSLLGALESRAIKQGNTRCTLSSTVTARRFYLSGGYSEEPPMAHEFGILSYPMFKLLAQKS